jgi:hypothetical protein
MALVPKSQEPMGALLAQRMASDHPAGTDSSEFRPMLHSGEELTRLVSLYKKVEAGPLI